MLSRESGRHRCDLLILLQAVQHKFLPQGRGPGSQTALYFGTGWVRRPGQSGGLGESGESQSGLG